MWNDTFKIVFYVAVGPWNDFSVFQPKKPTLNMQCSAQMPFFPDYSLPDLTLTIPSLGFLSPLLRPFLYCFILILPCIPFFSLDPSWVCPSLCAQDWPECLAPNRHGISVCWLTSPGRGTQAWVTLVEMERRWEVSKRLWRKTS